MKTPMAMIFFRFRDFLSYFLIYIYKIEIPYFFEISMTIDVDHVVLCDILSIKFDEFVFLWFTIWWILKSNSDLMFLYFHIIIFKPIKYAFNADWKNKYKILFHLLYYMTIIRKTKDFFSNCKKLLLYVIT